MPLKALKNCLQKSIKAFVKSAKDYHDGIDVRRHFSRTPWSLQFEAFLKSPALDSKPLFKNAMVTPV